MVFPFLYKTVHQISRNLQVHAWRPIRILFGYLIVTRCLTFLMLPFFCAVIYFNVVHSYTLNIRYWGFCAQLHIHFHVFMPLRGQQPWPEEALCFRVVLPSVRSFLMKPMSQERLEGITSNLAPIGLKVELI